MPAYMQMGHDTQNLIGEKGLELFTGIILSPVNRNPEELKNDILKFKQIKKEYDIFLDPQFYMPKIDRGELGNHPYFSKEIDSIDLSSFDWWKFVCDNLLEYGKELTVNTIASPVVIPSSWSEEYFLHCNDVSNYLVAKSIETQIYSTVLIPFAELTTTENINKIASMVSVSKAIGFYIIFVSDKEPRRELSNAGELFGAMQFINLLKKTDKTLCIGFCSSEFILYKAAGAHHCSSGIFFNLRRFTKSRFEEPNESGGGQLAYWTEEGLLGFIRDADILRLEKSKFPNILLSGSSNNQWSKIILENLKSENPSAWLAQSWRQYLAWFCLTEKKLDDEDRLKSVDHLLINSEKNWLDLEDENVLFDEPRNNGGWIRPWRQALIDFKKLNY